MKILHTYCLNNNLGDYALGMGVKNILRKYLPVELVAETNLQGQVFNEYYIENVVNVKYDLLVIGGGGIIHGAHWPSGWFWLIEKELISKIKIPFIVYGVGYNYFKDEAGIPERGISHLKETLLRAKYFSVRNDESLERFSEVFGESVFEVPDPGFHVNLNRHFLCSEKAKFVVVQLANDKPEFRFSKDGSRNQFLAEMRKVVADLAKRYKVILAPHVFEDIELCESVSLDINNTEIWNFSSYAFDRVSDCLGYYERAEFVLAMRGHGQILPIAFNTPVIALDNHPKHGGLMRKLGIDEYCVSVLSPGFLESILSKVNFLEMNRDVYVSRLKEINRHLESSTKDAFVSVRKSLNLSSELF
ncbi:polysaccharide pyruvyl transferase family protein [Gammaproteobacteria bacterium]|nr:polysaccharide pyruvyl transferase family protein [Gammaproteobacteria bacterium]